MSDTKAIGQRYMALFQGGEFDDAREVIAPGITFRINGVDLPPGITTLERRVAAFDVGAPDSQLSIEQLVTDGATVAVRYRVEGTHTGPLHLAGVELAPTGRRFAYSGAAFLTIRDGRVVREESVADARSALLGE